MQTQRTFDQLRDANPSLDAVVAPDAFQPHEAMNARIVFEPMPNQGHVRITARSEDYELLWGVTVSPTMLTRHPVEVAFYERLIERAKEHLPPMVAATGTDAISLAQQQIKQLRIRIDSIEKSITPKKVSDKTEKRASRIVSDLNDAVRLLDALTSTEDEK